MGVIEGGNIIYVVIALLLLLNVVVIFIAIKCAHPVDDDFELYDDDGNHTYYDRKLIRHNKRVSGNSKSK